MPNCPECVFKKRNVIIEEHKDDEDVNLNQLLDEVEVLMKFDPVTKHFICKRCGLYATREQVGDIRERINRKESTREDKQYDYLSWWQKSKKLVAEKRKFKTSRDNCTKSCTLCSMGKTDISICTSAVHWKTIQQTV